MTDAERTSHIKLLRDEARDWEKDDPCLADSLLAGAAALEAQAQQAERACGCGPSDVCRDDACNCVCHQQQVEACCCPQWATGAWFLLFDGRSPDGRGRGDANYIGRTLDPLVARAHAEQVERNAYSTGYVLMVTDTTQRMVRSKEIRPKEIKR